MKFFSKQLITTFTVLLIAANSFAQIKGLTESGDEVLLYQDGTWVYAADSNTLLSTVIKTNDQIFTKSKKATFMVKSKKIKVGVFINPKEWRFIKSDDSEPSEFRFEKINGDLYAMLITEKIGIPLKSLSQIAFENARKVAPDTKLIEQEYRTVNGSKLIMMQLTGTIQNIKFIYFGYYYSDDNGSVQFLTYTSANLFDEYKNDMEKFLNGLVILR